MDSTSDELDPISVDSEATIEDTLSTSSSTSSSTSRRSSIRSCVVRRSSTRSSLSSKQAKDVTKVSKSKSTGNLPDYRNSDASSSSCTSEQQTEQSFDLPSPPPELTLAERRALEHRFAQHRQWIRNTPFSYQLVAHNVLEWPSKTVEWLDLEIDSAPHNSPTKGHKTYPLVLGTTAKSGLKNRLLVYHAQVSNYDLMKEFEPREKSFIPRMTWIACNLRTEHVKGSVQCARSVKLSLDSEYLVATKNSTDHDVSLYTAKYSLSKRHNTLQNNSLSFTMILSGHSASGSALAWNMPHQSNSTLLLSGDNDGTVCIWDVASSRNLIKPKDKLAPVLSFRAQLGAIDDVQWSPHEGTVYALCGKDRTLSMYDYRSPPTQAPLKIVTFTAQVTSLSFNPVSKEYLLTSFDDGSVCLWDDRKLSSPVHTLDYRFGASVNAVKWSPHKRNVFATAHADLVLIWDLDKVNQTQSEEDAIEGPSELVFLHGGHRAIVNDFDWNPFQPGVVASVDQLNDMFIWKPKERVSVMW